MIDFAAALQSVSENLQSLGHQFALVGGIAIGARGEPRFTQDVDLAVAVDSDETAETLIKSLHSRGYRLTSLVEQDAVGRLATARMLDVKQELVVDLLFASSGLEPEIASMAEKITLFDGLELPVAVTGHLIATKVLSRDDNRRPQDKLDLQNLFSVAEAAEIELARQSVELIGQRGYDRGLDLKRRFEEALMEFSE